MMQVNTLCDNCHTRKKGLAITLMLIESNS